MTSIVHEGHFAAIKNAIIRDVLDNRTHYAKVIKGVLERMNSVVVNNFRLHFFLVFRKLVHCVEFQTIVP